MWYLILNGLETVDYLGAVSDGRIGFFMPFHYPLGCLF
jgi:hypothetical protein